MALKKFNPTTPSQRQLVVVDRSELYKGRPEKTLTEGLHSKGGRNNLGRITMRRRGGGAKNLYRIIDFKRRKFDIEAKVERLEYDPNRTAFIALVKYLDGELAYIIAPQRLKAGDKIIAGDKVDVILTYGRDEDLKTVTIIQNLRVIGVDQESNAEKENPGIARTVTLEATGEDSQKLALAQKAGTLSLALRTIENDDEQVLESISLRDVLQEPEPVETAAPAQVTVRTVTVRRGVEATEDEVN